MKIFNRAKGIQGEQLALKYLSRHKFKILEKNYTCPVGEADIIAINNGMLVILEVKSWSTLEFGRPAEAVDSVKQRKLQNIALFYQKKKRLLDMPIRFDVVEVLGEEINHIENAF